MNFDERPATELVEALNVVGRVGVLVLQSGAASFRAKDMMHRVAASLGVGRLGTLVTPTAIVVTINGVQGNYTEALRVPILGVNMSRVSALDALCNRIAGGATAAQVSAMLEEIEHSAPAYTPLTVVMAVAAACGAFAIVLGGSVPEFIAAAVGAAAAQTLRLRMVKRGASPYLVTVVCAALATAISYAFVQVLHAPLPRSGLIASVLLLVPGAPLVTSMLDLVHLDLNSGVARGVYAGLLLINIGIGMLLVLAITGFTIQ